eukprot:CAMPEP_0172484928 /NCGR_PEP_ID=MMETSP1066-20121228/12606_1 /TAXON_ID=671091 /ORGANISM="Coscinodiscus wailesii, Strain CCMP2513" /LENGTH=196 /DNA_ID=CAMNT_0013249769 /DNA_START=244 /DNA_END=834 /DNA_ORIENTATION=+
MPALSPTMESGTIASWNVSEGDVFAAGDSLAEIETDKATMAFEAQDDGYVAKILVEAGQAELKVGQPILVTVEEEEDVPAFKDFVAEVRAEPAPAEEPVEEPVAAAVEAAAPPPPAPVAAAVEAAAPPPPTPVAAPAAVDVPEVVVSADVGESPEVVMVAPVWGEMIKTSGPLLSMLSSSQKEYTELYGSTGHTPL